MAVASGVPSSKEHQRSRQLGQHDVLDYDPGAPVTFGSESPCDLKALRSQSARNSVSSAAARRVTGSRRSKGCRPEPRPHDVFVPDRIDP
ncbi:MAG: hypothetical protein K0S35_1273 [Geminicoccaceae bacterium]|jgi:hypothetical protein|nr:hypothetical protein [Geminicoccaceae bacterium]